MIDGVPAILHPGELDARSGGGILQLWTMSTVRSTQKRASSNGLKVLQKESTAATQFS